MKVEYAGVNWLDTAVRKGAFPMPIPPLPQPLGSEAAGTIVALPTDESVLSDEEYKLRGFRLGARVALVMNVLRPLSKSTHIYSLDPHRRWCICRVRGCGMDGSDTPPG